MRVAGDAGPLAPGRLVISDDPLGAGACSHERLSDVLAALHARYPELADVHVVCDPTATTTDGGIVAGFYVFATSDGFAIVVARGSDDCESGCVNHAYSYFETDSSCVPRQVGQYSQTADYNRNCNVLVGTPMWGQPPPAVDTSFQCVDQADN